MVKISWLHIMVYMCYFLVSVGYGQRIYVEAGFSGASFKNFENRLGEHTLTNRYSRPQEPGFSMGVLFDHFRETIWLDAGLQYNNYHINTSVLNAGSSLPLSYDFSFFSLRAGAHLKIADFSQVRLRVHGHISHGWLTQGTRRSGNTFVDLLEDGHFYDTLLSHHFGGSVEFDIMRNMALYLLYDIKGSFNKNDPIDESYRVKVMALSIGLQFDLKYY